MTEPKDTWESLGAVTTRLMAKLEEEQRVLFLNLCRQDGIKPARRASELEKQGVGHE
jgi:hypothetical protein